MWNGEGEIVPGAGSAADASSVPQASSGEGVSDLVAAIEIFCERPKHHLSPRQLAQELTQLRHACDRLELEFSLSAARFAASDEYDLQGSVSPTSWIRHQCRMSGHAAAERVS